MYNFTLIISQLMLMRLENTYWNTDFLNFFLCNVRLLQDF